MLLTIQKEVWAASCPTCGGMIGVGLDAQYAGACDAAGVAVKRKPLASLGPICWCSCPGVPVELRWFGPYRPSVILPPPVGQSVLMLTVMGEFQGVWDGAVWRFQNTQDEVDMFFCPPYWREKEDSREG